MEKQALVGGGCFWGVEARFQGLDGVIATEVGYAGGHTEDPTYRDVCKDNTGHAESVLITYDPEKISYKQLLEAFFSFHDPTTSNSQGPDFGSQYRSVIFYNTEEQKETAEKLIAELDAAGTYRRKIVTQVVPACPFFSAEDYHQQYYQKRGLSSCCG